MKDRKQILRQTVLASLLTAMTAVLTCYIKIPAQNGYFHIGDSVIYLAACLLPTPFAIFCGAVGGMASDIISGYTMYALPSFIIKALLVPVFSSKTDKISDKRNFLASVLNIPITVAGYYITEAVLISAGGNFTKTLLSPVPWISALHTIPMNLIQSAASSVIFIVSALALDKANIKQRIHNA